MSLNDWFFPRDRLAHDGWETVVGPHLDGWRHTGLRIADLHGEIELPIDAVERMVVPLAGAFRVDTTKQTWELQGRRNVFAGPTDVLYLGAGSSARISGRGRVAVAEAPTEQTLPDTYLAVSEVPVEIRGAGRSTRQVHNFGTPSGLDASKLIVCEVITPAENWSSYPPHKHDEASPSESRLEEIYYFEAASSRSLPAPRAADPFGMFVTYSSAAGHIDTAARVRSGDVALVPFGYHGPAAAAPGYDLYYLNVMAGPDPERAWRISDDPAHAWIRDTWNGQQPDPRLPYREDHR